jgi:hypothetical protein
LRKTEKAHGLFVVSPSAAVLYILRVVTQLTCGGLTRLLVSPQAYYEECETPLLSLDLLRNRYRAKNLSFRPERMK